MAQNSTQQPRTYFISSCNNLTEVKANKRTASHIIDLFCTVKVIKEYQQSSLVKVQNHQISQQLLQKLLIRTLIENVVFSDEQKRTLEPYSPQLQRLSGFGIFNNPQEQPLNI